MGQFSKVFAAQVLGPEFRSQNLCEKSNIAASACNPRTGKWRLRDPENSLASQSSQLVSSRFSERDFASKNNVESDRRTHLPLNSDLCTSIHGQAYLNIHVHMHVCAHTFMYTQIYIHT